MKRSALIACALIMTSCGPATSRQMSAVETAQAQEAQALRETQTAQQAQIARATFDAQDVIARDLDLRQRQQSLDRAQWLLAQEQERARLDAIAEAEALRAQADWRIFAQIVLGLPLGLALFGSACALIVYLVNVTHDRRQHAQALLNMAAEIARAEHRQRLDEIVGTSDALILIAPDARHRQAWEAALFRAFQWGQKIGWTESAWRAHNVTYYPEADTFDDQGRRTIARMMDEAEFTWQQVGRAREWRPPYGEHSRAKDFWHRMPLPRLPAGDPPTVRVPLRSSEEASFVRGSGVTVIEDDPL